jgi:hypothetical protein
MDGVLGEFLEESGLRGGAGGRKKNGKGKVKVEGVWVRCLGSDAGADTEIREEQWEDGESDDDGEDDEQDEMIWWCWDGKIVGFSDW